MPYLVPGPQADGSTNIAWPWYQAGCATIPIRTDGTKRPRVRWEPYIQAAPTADEVHGWFENTDAGVAIICGAVSGNLEMLELEGRACDGASLDKVVDACIRHQVLEVWENLTQQGFCEWTPSGGMHLIYRVNGGTVPGNTKLATRPASTAELVTNPKDLWKTLAETRGEGGYVIVAPTGGHCHASGEAWTCIAGAPGTIPAISWEDRCALHAAVSSALDFPRPAPVVQPRPPRALPQRDGLLSPGDDYAQRTDWADLLEPAGWVLESTRGQERMWTRPGKDPKLGASATTDYAGKPGLYVFSSSAGLPTEVPLTKLYVYAYYHHGGDMSAAARQLSRDGFGQRNVAVRDSAQSDFMGNVVADFFEEDESLEKVGDDFQRGQKFVTGLPGSEVAVPQVDLKYFTHTDVGNAERLSAVAGDLFRWVPVRGKWMFWDERQWKTDFQGSRVTREMVVLSRQMLDQAKADDDETFTKFATRCLGSERISAAVKMFKTEPNVWAEPEDFDANRNLVNLTNGILNLDTATLMPHDPQHMCTKMMGAAFDATAQAPRWREYLDQVLPDPEIQRFVQKMAGYTLAGNPVQRALAILHGPGGTGKSRFVEVLAHVFGSYGTTAAESLFRSKREASGPTNDLNDLRGARLASVSELDNGIKMDETLVKRLTGLDRVTSRGLFEENQTWMPRCVIWLATNHLPRISSDDGAIWDRMKVIPFREQIAPADRDPFILDKLIAEADGIFQWILEGLIMYLADGLEVPDSVRAEVGAYRSEQDVVLQFVDDSLREGRIVASEHTMIEKTQLFAMFRQWCGDNQEAGLGRVRFDRRVLAMGYESVQNGRWYWIGLTSGNHGILGTMT